MMILNKHSVIDYMVTNIGNVPKVRYGKTNGKNVIYSTVEISRCLAQKLLLQMWILGMIRNK